MKKKTTIGIVLSVVGLAVTIIQIVTKVGNFMENKTPEHYFGDTAQYIEKLSEEEQETLLTFFDVVIPPEENEAYVVSFGQKDYNGNYRAYFIEIDGVKDTEAFYAANAHREPSVNQTTGTKADVYIVYAERISLIDKEKHYIAQLFDKYMEAR